MKFLAKARCRSGWKGHQHWLENYAFIEADDSIIKTVRQAGGLRKGQRMLLSLSYHQRKIWKCPERTIIDKFRQEGFSTLEALQMYWDVKEQGWSGAVIAHDLPSAEYLFEKFERCHHNDVLDKPDLRTANIRQIRFGNQQGRVEVCTAASPTALRSRTLQTIHGSEVAYWGDEGPKLHKAVMKFVGQKPHTSVVYESTANMEDPLFYPMWQNAEKYCHLEFIEDETAPYGFKIERTITEPDKWNKFHPLFISVLINARASMDLEEGEDTEILESLNSPEFGGEEEEWLLTSHDASFEFLKWRRYTIVHESNGDLNDFHQEYPVTAAQSFVSFGKLRFDWDVLNKMPIENGTHGTLSPPSFRKGIEFRDDPQAPLIIFRPPESGHRYVMAIDPAEGIPSENPNCVHCSGESDEFSCQVYDIDAGPKIEQVALLAGGFSEDEMSRPCRLLAEWFNYAYVVIETVGGFGTHMRSVFEESYPGDRLYHEEGTRAIGLKVHRGNRMGLIDEVASSVHEGLVDIHSERTIHQLKVIKRVKPTRDEAISGHHDDDLASLWGVIRGWQFYPRHLQALEQQKQTLERRRRGLLTQIGEPDSLIANPDMNGFY